MLNGELLRQAEDAGVEVFVTADRKMEHQQRLTGRKFGVAVLNAGGTWRLCTLSRTHSAILWLGCSRAN